jgi:hypothetical protein
MHPMFQHPSAETHTEPDAGNIGNLSRMTSLRLGPCLP